MANDSPAVRAARREVGRAVLATGNAEAALIRARKREREVRDALALALAEDGGGATTRLHVDPSGAALGGAGGGT